LQLSQFGTIDVDPHLCGNPAIAATCGRRRFTEH